MCLEGDLAMKHLVIGVVSVLAVSCSQSGDSADDGAFSNSGRVSSIMDTDDCPARYLDDVTMQEQEPMSQACQSLHGRLRSANIIEHGGVRPGVQREIWRDMNAEQQAEVFLEVTSTT